MSKHILLIDDDRLLRRSLAFNLEKAGYRATTAADAESGLALALRDPPDLILLDIALPGMDGLGALSAFRQGLSAPVIFLTARRRELDEILGLELGADDCVTKPFEVDVLLARVRAVLRRALRDQVVPSRSQRPVVAGDLTIDPRAHSVILSGRQIDLSPRTFDLLHALALEAGRVVSVDDFLDRVWGAEFEGEPQVVYVHIRWLREKLEDDPHHPLRVVTVRGIGYKLQPKAVENCAPCVAG